MNLTSISPPPELLTSNSSSMVMIPEAAALQSLLDGRLEKLQAHNEGDLTLDFHREGILRKT